MTTDHDIIRDLDAAAAPKSDQLNADDLAGGPRTVTVLRVVRGPSAEQPIEIVLRDSRPYRPCKSMARVLSACWGSDTQAWPADARITLYCDPAVAFGGAVVGGIRISHLSALDAPRAVPITVTRGRRRLHHVEPLPSAPTLADILSAAGLDLATCDRWLAAHNKPPAGDSPERHAALASWLTADAARVEQIRAYQEVTL